VTLLRNRWFSVNINLARTSVDRELNKLIAAQDHPESTFRRHSETDATVYPAPDESSEPPSKKRKVLNGEGGTEGNHQEHPRYLEHVKSNQHVKELHSIVKKECEVIAELIVGHCSSSTGLAFSY